MSDGLMVAMYRYTTIAGIADEFGMSYGAVRRRLIAAGVTLRPRGVSPKQRLKYKPPTAHARREQHIEDLVGQMVQLYEAGYTIRQVAGSVNLSYSVVRGRLLLYGVTLRPKKRYKRAIPGGSQ